jgi:hypothetical protein
MMSIRLESLFHPPARQFVPHHILDVVQNVPDSAELPIHDDQRDHHEYERYVNLEEL